MPRKPSPLSPSPAALQLDNQVCFALYSASLAMTKLYKPLLDAIGLTYPQYLVMLVLWEGDGITVSALGERLYLDSGTLTPLLKRLETSGLIARLRDAEDERRVRISLTPAGRLLRDAAERIPHCVLQSSQCTLPELAALTGQLKTLRARLNAP
ncbi:MarR family winged helix-turn-helix transcriptional regulator [Acidovorax carolinensis]|uniref:MarR family transcriptional regulator n=1 Tax=Acidovorax carolinensis TaxID=553814 RepID=A0A240TPL4_9BURK|nr:MarR family transcriptional regulator [Acidovorax carolinensis]ART47070.1 MarR family transcriptional regulator [Acidovorax carolinensis]ART56175.1 MarR family transcriptional regulator [Acidovorax carolinensis]ART57885.1 MarR family transcriptional regulator [Acidovorax carolinensis]